MITCSALDPRTAHVHYQFISAATGVWTSFTQGKEEGKLTLQIRLKGETKVLLVPFSVKDIKLP